MTMISTDADTQGRFSPISAAASPIGLALRLITASKTSRVWSIARVQRNPLALKKIALEAKARGEKDPDVIVTLAERLHAVIRQLRERREGRPTLDVADEYDLSCASDYSFRRHS